MSETAIATIGKLTASTKVKSAAGICAQFCPGFLAIQLFLLFFRLSTFLFFIFKMRISNDKSCQP
jgi:hypothetical protein